MTWLRHHWRNWTIIKTQYIVIKWEKLAIGVYATNIMIFWDCRPGELAQLVAEIIGQIKKIAITASNRKDHMFLGINVDRNGCITKENLRFLCEKLHLPSSNDIIDAVSYHALFH